MKSVNGSDGFESRERSRERRDDEKWQLLKYSKLKLIG
jgi:hypothetical protein